VDELLILAEGWASLHTWRRFQQTWVEAIKENHRAFLRKHSPLVKVAPLLIDWPGQREKLTIELKRINDLTKEQFPELYGNVFLPDLDPCADPFPENDATYYAQKMKALLGMLLARKCAPPANRRPGAPPDPDHKTIVDRAQELRRQKKEWKEVAGILNGELGRDDLDGEKVRNRCRGKPNRGK
jgi:hypothetical protein